MVLKNRPLWLDALIALVIVAGGGSIAVGVVRLLLPVLPRGRGFDVVQFPRTYFALWLVLLIEYGIANVAFRRITGRASLWRWITNVADRIANRRLPGPD